MTIFILHLSLIKRVGFEVEVVVDFGRQRWRAQKSFSIFSSSLLASSSPSSHFIRQIAMADNSSQLLAIKNTYRDEVLNLLCDAASRSEQSVSAAAIQKSRDDATINIIALNISPHTRDELLKAAEQEAQQMYPAEISRRRSASSSVESRADHAAAADDTKSASNAAPKAAQPAPTKSAKVLPVEINLPEHSDEFDFISPPHFSASNPLHKSLKQQDQSYRCSICSELYTTPVAVMPCLHIFCSECIRKHCKFSMGNMKRECRCPECNQFVSFHHLNFHHIHIYLVLSQPWCCPDQIGNASQNYENKIIPFHLFASQVDNYKQMREGLRNALARLDVLEKERATQDTALTGGHAATTAVKRKSEETVETRSSTRARRNASKKTKYADDSSDSDNDNDSDFEVVEPPVENKQQSRPKVTLQRKTVASYHGLKRKKLVELCSKEGLPIDGSDEELKKRHSEFITLYNSECDAEYPRSVSELIKEIKKREVGRKVCCFLYHHALF